MPWQDDPVVGGGAATADWQSDPVIDRGKRTAGVRQADIDQAAAAMQDTKLGPPPDLPPITEPPVRVASSVSPEAYGGLSPEEQSALVAQTLRKYPTVENAAQAVSNLASGMVPRDLPGYLESVGGPLNPYSTFRRSQRLASGDISEVPLVGRIPEIAAAEKTPGGSVERWQAGLATINDMALLAGLTGGARPPLRAPVPDAWAPPGTQLAVVPQPFEGTTPDLATAIARARETRMQRALAEQAARQVEPQAQPPQQIEGPAPEYDPMAAARWHQAVQAEMQPLIAQEYLLKKMGQPIPKPLADAIKAGNEKLQKGYQPPPEQRFVIPAQPEVPTNAIQPSNAQVQTRGAPLGVEARTIGPEPGPGDRYNVVGETQGAEAGAPIARPEGSAEGAQPGTPAPPATGQPAPAAPEPRLTSTKNAIVDQERIARGLQPIAADAGEAHPIAWAQAERRLQDNPQEGRILVDEINSGKKKAIEKDDEAVLLREKIATQTAREGAAQKLLDPTISDTERTRLRTTYDTLETYSQELDQAMHKTGSLWSEFGRFRQMLAAEDYTLQAVERRMRIARGPGKPISPQESASLSAETGKIRDLETKVQAIQDVQAHAAELQRTIEQTRTEAKAAKAKSKFTEFTARKADEARARLAEKRREGRLYTGVDPTILRDHAIIGADYLAKGITKFADWSTAMVREFGERVRPFLKDLWQQSKALHQAAAREYGEKALARYKTYLGKQTEEIKGKLERGDLTKATRQKTKLDAEAFTMRAELQRLKNQLDKRIAMEAYKNKTPAQKFWDHFVGVERAMKLSGPEVFGKLGIAAAAREVLAPAEAAVGYGVSKVFPRLAAGTRYGASLKGVVRAEIKAKAALFTKGMADAARNVKGRETELEAIGDKKYATRPDFWYNRIGKMHAAIKAPVKRAEFVRSLEHRMEAATKAGEDINHPEVMTRLSNEAVMDSNRAIFQQNSVVSNFFSMLDRQMPAAARVARFLFPVVKIPVNLFKELVTYHAGAPYAAARIGQAYWRGIETLPPLEREAIIRQLVKGSVGGAGLLWGYFNSDKVRAFFDSMPTWFQHTPFAMILNEGSYLKKMEAGEPEGAKGLKHMAKTDIPFMYTVTDITSALDTHNSHALSNWVNNMVKSTVVPQLAQQVAKQMDKPGTFPMNLGEKPTYRPPKTMVEAIMTGIPGLREQVGEGHIGRLKVSEMTPRERVQHALKVRNKRIEKRLSR